MFARTTSEAPPQTDVMNGVIDGSISRPIYKAPFAHYRYLTQVVRFAAKLTAFPRKQRIN